MPSALTPELALALVRELSCDVVAAQLRSADGERLAGDEDVGAGALRVRAEGLEIAVALGPQGMPALVRHDAGRALAALSRPEGAR